jgi:peptide/nickel transport system permease protein
MTSIAKPIKTTPSVQDTSSIDDVLRAQPSAWKAVKRFLRTKPLGTVGGFIVLMFILTAIFAEQIMPYPYDECKGCPLRQAPSGSFIMGTDNLGRDMLSRIIFGARISVSVGFGAVFIGTGLATLIGILSGYWGGKVDLMFQRLIDIWISIPALVLLIVIMSVFTTRNTGSATSIVLVAVSLGIIVASGSSRVVRSTVIAIRHMPYMEAARCIGASDWRVITRYVLPNIFAPIIILATTGLGGAILAESTLSFLGFGVKPPMPAWGSMLSGSGRQYFLLAPWLAIWPGLAISIVVFGFNMFGDALRDVLDPRLRGSR